MKVLLNTPTSTEPKERLPWRLHHDYPAPLPTVSREIETSTESLLESPPLEIEELPIDLSHKIAEAILASVGLPELCRIYVALMRQIQEVRLVLLRAEGESAYILTLIDAPPLERLTRDRVYLAQQTVLETISSPPVEFRLINGRELQEDVSHIIPSDATVLYERK